MKAIDAVFGRRSIRKFLDKAVDEKDVRLLLKAGMVAPSARKKRPWKFVVVSSKEKLTALKENLPNAPMIVEAPLTFFVCLDKEAAYDLDYGIIDCSAAAENILITAHALHLGAVWLGIYPRMDRVEHVSKVLGLSENLMPVHGISIGHPAETKEPNDIYDENLVRWIQG